MDRVRHFRNLQVLDNNKHVYMPGMLALLHPHRLEWKSVSLSHEHLIRLSSWSGARVMFEGRLTGISGVPYPLQP